MKKKLYGLVLFIVCLSFSGIALALTPIEQLGKAVYEDPAFSAGGNQSCKTCHHPNSGFADPVNRKAPTFFPVSEGSIPGLFGGRNAPPVAYAAYSPPLYWDGALFIGGLFWDGRASGLTLTATGGLGDGPTFDPLADQAKGPFGNPVEMALVDDSSNGGYTTEQKVVQIFKLAGNNYAKGYSEAFPEDTPVQQVDLTDLGGVGIAYNNISLAISAFEKSNVINKFTSKFDAFRLEQLSLGTDISTLGLGDTVTSAIYTPQEIRGFLVFNDQTIGIGAGRCSLCHLTGNINATTPTVLTDFSYDNLGIPVNPRIAELIGQPQNTDYGLGAQIDILEEAYGGILITEVMYDVNGNLKVYHFWQLKNVPPL